MSNNQGKTTPAWMQRIVDYCDEYNIPYQYLPDTLLEPKVVPMIRGKAFEFSAMIVLDSILDKNEWAVTKVKLNAQLGFHDMDVVVTHKKSGRKISVECKLAKKGGYRQYPDGHSEIRVKCMRSRTLGPAKVKELAPKLGIPIKALSIHNDQYTEKDFDVVITSIGNAFYRTDKDTQLFVWSPKEKEIQFLRNLFNAPKASVEELKKLSFERLYLARAEDIVVKRGGSVVCTRRKCKDKRNCGFIPDYPVILFSKKNEPTNKWYPTSEAESFFKKVLRS